MSTGGPSQVVKRRSERTPPPLQYVGDRVCFSDENDASKTNPRDVLVDESKQAAIENLGDCLRAHWATANRSATSRSRLSSTAARKPNWSNSGPSSLASSPTPTAIYSPRPTTNSMPTSPLYPATTRSTCASCIFCTQTTPTCLFLFTILPGEKTNAHLGTEYLAVLETDNSTPYFLNLHNGEVAHTLILGMTGSGKSFLRKYTPQQLSPMQMDLPLSPE
jgi:type IV secretion system protein VirB4